MLRVTIYPVVERLRETRMHRIWAIIERDMRRLRRSPMLVIVSILMPIMQLVVLGYAFGGRIRDLEIGVLDQDQGVPAVRLKEVPGRL